MGKPTRFKLHAVLSLLLLNYFCTISAQELISKSKVNSPANGQSTRKTVKVGGENLIVAEEISCWEQNGHWEKLQVCPNSTIVTGHRFRYLVRTGLTGIELKCTEKYGQDKSESAKILVINFENKVEKDLPRGKWENWKNGSGSVFAAGFSFNRGELSLGRSVKNYDLIYHSGNQTAVKSDSDKVVRKCPEDHAICGVTAMMDKAQLGILTALGFKCCHHCVPEEKWVTIHHYNNTGYSEEEQTVSTTVGLQWSLTKSADSVKIPHSVLHTGFSTHFGKNSTAFDWTLTPYSIWTEKNPVKATLICEEQSSCVLKQIVGECGSARVPVAKFCTVSVPIGSLIPESCNLTPTLEQDPSEKTSVVKTVVDRNDSIPYQLSIRYNNNPPDGKWSHICDGVILDENTAITAAHCFEGVVNASHYRVVAGANALNTSDPEEQVLALKKVVVHPNYTTFTNGNDLAILHLDKFQFNKNVAGVWLSSFSNKELADKSAVKSGWGDVSSKKGLSNSLLKEILSILSPEDCLNRLQSRRKYAKVREGVVCAWNPMARTCTEDSGGPLVIQNFKSESSTGNLLIGISSFPVVNCAHLIKVGVFTEISSFYNWIQDTVTKRCGGFINLAQSPEQEIIYKVPSEDFERKRGSICLWIVSTGRKDDGASIRATILNDPFAQFNPDSDAIFATYNFTIDNNQYKTIIQGPFMTLYYRTNSSAPNAGFHLKLKDSIFQSNITERLGVKLVPVPNAKLNEGEIREFSYPSSGAVSGAFRYSSNERTFFILKPQKPGAKIRVNLKYLDTQEDHVWLQMNTYRMGPPALASFNGQKYWLREPFVSEGREDQPIFFYFHADQSDSIRLIGRKGFEIEYSEILAPKPKFSCGGFVELDWEKEMVYTVPEELRGGKSVCVWVIEAPWASSIEIELLSDPKAQFNTEESNIFVIYDFTKDADSHSKILSKDEKWTINHSFFVLYFRTNSSAPNAGFHILLKEKGQKRWQKSVKYLEVGIENGNTSEIQEFKYPPPPASEYANYERTFIVVKPGARHDKLKLELHYVDTDKGYDWVDVVSVESKPVSHFRFSGGDWTSGRVFEAAEDEPFIIYFRSDESGTYSGFEFSYAEKNTFEVKSHPLTFYEDRDFSGPEIRVNVRNFCQDVPFEWNDKVSSLNSTLCLTFYEDEACSSRSLQLTGNHSDLSLYDFDDKISSFEPCETTDKREKSPLFLTAYEFENYKGESTKLSLDCGCVGYKSGWNNRINSIKNPQNLCVYAFDDVRCKGLPIIITSGFVSFQSQRMNNRLTSFRICPGTSNCPRK